MAVKLASATSSSSVLPLAPELEPDSKFMVESGCETTTTAAPLTHVSEAGSAAEASTHTQVSRTQVWEGGQKTLQREVAAVVGCDGEKHRGRHETVSPWRLWTTRATQMGKPRRAPSTAPRPSDLAGSPGLRDLAGGESLNPMLNPRMQEKESVSSYTPRCDTACCLLATPFVQK